MALPRSFKESLLLFIAVFLGMCVINFGILIYFGLFTIPYLSPVVVALGDALSPLTPLIIPVTAYGNIKQWTHPSLRAYRATLRRPAYITGIIGLSCGAFSVVACILLRFSWVVESLYGLETETGMCIGPCWKLWTELGLLAVVILAEIVGLELDGGAYGRYLDRQLENLRKKDAERIAEEEKQALLADAEENAGDVKPHISV